MNNEAFRNRWRSAYGAIASSDKRFAACSEFIDIVRAKEAPIQVGGPSTWVDLPSERAANTESTAAIPYSISPHVLGRAKGFAVDTARKFGLRVKMTVTSQYLFTFY
jgi:hypothetical protein